jgi:hypothetical protein
MKERQPGDRLRVVIAGNIYATHAVVRRFLEDDGFDVAGEALTVPDLLATPELDRADAVVVDSDLLNGAIERLRGAAPDAAIVVVTNRTPGPARPWGADGYLEKGSGLASLTALLHTLLSEAPASALGGVWEEPRYPPEERRVLAGLAAIGAAVVVIALLSLAVFGDSGLVRSPVPTPGDRAAGTTASGPSAIHLAAADLHDLHEALLAGRVIEAQWLLDDLRFQLAAAEDAGYAISSLRSTATDLFRPLLGDVAPRLFDDLETLPGGFLSFLIAPASETGSTGIIDSTTETTQTTAPGVSIVTSDVTSTSSASGSGDTTGTSGGGSGGGAGGGSGGGAGGGSGGGAGGGSGGGGGGGGDSDAGGSVVFPAALTSFPGNGHHYGWSNKPPNGGWHGTKPHPSHPSQTSNGAGTHAGGQGNGRGK